MSDFPKVNSESPNLTTVEVGTNLYLKCKLTNTSAKKCEFHVYRVDKLGAAIDNQKEINFQSAKQKRYTSKNVVI